MDVGVEWRDGYKTKKRVMSRGRAWEPWCMDWVKVSGVRGVERGMHGENMDID